MDEIHDPKYKTFWQSRRSEGREATKGGMKYGGVCSVCGGHGFYMDENSPKGLDNMKCKHCDAEKDPQDTARNIRAAARSGGT